MFLFLTFISVDWDGWSLPLFIQFVRCALHFAQCGVFLLKNCFDILTLNIFTSHCNISLEWMFVLMVISGMSSHSRWSNDNTLTAIIFKQQYLKVSSWLSFYLMEPWSGIGWICRVCWVKSQVTWHTGHVRFVLDQCWYTIYDTDPALSQYGLKVSFFMHLIASHVCWVCFLYILVNLVRGWPSC